MKKEYGSIGSEYQSVSEWQQPKEHMDNSHTEYFEYGREYWKEGLEYEGEKQGPSLVFTGQDASEAKKKAAKQKRTKLLNKMVYTVASAAMVVTMAKTVEPEASVPTGGMVSTATLSPTVMPSLIPTAKPDLEPTVVPSLTETPSTTVPPSPTPTPLPTMMEAVTVIFSGMTELTEEMVQAELAKYPQEAWYHVILEDGILEIGAEAFRERTHLLSVELPESVTEIGEYVFSGCENLVIDRMETAERSIGNYAFRGVTIGEYVIEQGYEPSFFSVCDAKIEKVSIGEDVTEIPQNALNYCTSITELELLGNVIKIGDYAFLGCSGLERIVIPESVIKIGNEAFKGCNNLVLERLGTEGRRVESNAFNGVTIQELVLEPGYTASQLGAFDGAEVKKLTIREDVTEIPANALRYCSSITEVVIPEGVTKIGVSAFGDCDNLTSIALPEGITEIGECAFMNCKNPVFKKLIAEGIIGDNAFAYTTIEELVIGPGYKPERFEAFRKAEIGKVSFAEGLTELPGNALRECNTITEIELPDGLLEIGSHAFLGCSGLTKVVIPDSVTGIWAGAFSGCDNLTLIVTAGSAAEAYAMENSIKYEIQ